MKRFLVLSIACAASFFVQAVSADVLRYLGPAYGGYINTYGLTNTPSPVNSHPKAGGLLMDNLTTPAADSFAAWCVDIFHYLDTAAPWPSYTLVDGNTFYSGSPKVAQLERLATQHLSSLSTVQKSGAFQLAVWEIVNETGGTYSLSDGSFRVANASGTAISTANSWLSTVNEGEITLKLNVWQQVVPGSTQDIAVFTTPVPESEVYAMLLAGLGLMGFVARRRKGDGY